ncbi:hypothetical protein SAMN03159343_1812 [Klenkia marina]|uniref:DUF3093 domain-containing protein n=1 Tax=Klenkia marina TaxID=1960309 RepID=A0A1G4XZE2_9ACTN|nr:hypothetical protein [Klenkia marina]SCX46493.1 hypothetical protein SAMN03159343_1812 [Klenkia marina]
MTYTEPGGSWRTLWTMVGAFVVLAVLDVVLPGQDVPLLVWVVAVVAVLGIVAAGTVSANRVWTVTVTDRGPDAGLTVGRERLPLAEVDPTSLDGEVGADVGAPVLGGGADVPKGRVGLPLRRTDGTTVLVPTRRPAQLRVALRTALTGAAGPDEQPGTVGP